MKPGSSFTWLWFVIAIVATMASMRLGLPWWAAIVLSANAATFMLYGLDKILAGQKMRRVPERTLHLAAFLLGSPGALVAMHVFRHKTRKTSFQFTLALLVLVQTLIVVGFVYTMGPSPSPSFPNFSL